MSKAEDAIAAAFMKLPRPDRSKLLLRLSRMSLDELAAQIDAALKTRLGPDLHTIRKTDSDTVRAAKLADNKQIRAMFDSKKLK